MEKLVEDVLGLYERGCFREFMQRAEAVKENVRIKAVVGRCYLKGWGVSQDEKRGIGVRGRATPFLNTQWESGLVKGLISRKMNPRLSSGTASLRSRDMPLRSATLG